MQATAAPNFSREVMLAALVITASVVLLYGHILHVPFYLDDHGFIAENYLLRDLPEAFKHVFAQRGLTQLSFALNYRLTGLSLPPLHLTNIVLHTLCGMLVWLLLRQMVQGRWLALLGALLFVIHPLQTQAVTYLAQRATILGTFFSLVAIFCYLRVRAVLAEGGFRNSRRYLFPYLGAVLAGACAVLAKENTATLPLVLMSFDWLFPLPFTRSRRQAFLDYLPFFIAPLLLGGAILLRLFAGTELTSQVGGLISLAHNSPLNYLVTQFSVVWIYLRLLLLPFDQALEHNYPVTGEIFALQNVAAFAGWLILGWLFWHLRQRRPLLVFGAVWFLCGLLVESSIIPLDPLFEHRLYLPMFGFVLVLLDCVPALLGEKRAWALLGVMLLFWMPLTWRRNTLWGEPVAFYEANLQLSPRSERVGMALMLLYKDAGRFADAERMARALIEINPHFNVAWQELAGLLARRGAGNEALAVVEAALQQLSHDPEIFRTGAMVRMTMGDPKAAIDFMRRGVMAAPQSARMHNWLAALYFELGELPKAEAAYRESLRLSDRVASTHKNLAKVLYGKGRILEALEELQSALLLAPGSPDILEGMVRSALVLGDMETAKRAADKLRYSDPEVWRELQVAIALHPQAMP